VSHLLQFRNHSFDSPGANEKGAVGKATDDLLSQLLSGEKLLGKDGVLCEYEADAAVQLHRYAPAGAGSRGIESHCRLIVGC
jgi:hypothetical protein